MKPWFVRAELSLALFTIVSYCARLAGIPSGNLLFMIGLFSLAFLYVLISNGPGSPNHFSPFKEGIRTTNFDITYSRVCGLSISVCLVGILFYVLHFSGANIMLLAGSFSAIFITFFSLIHLSVKSTELSKQMVFRLVPVSILGGSLLINLFLHPATV